MNPTVLILLGFVALCCAHVHIMDPHQETLNVALNGKITIKCESMADKDIKWLFNHKPLVASSHVLIADVHESHADQHKGHDHNEEHDHSKDDEIDKALHDAQKEHEDDHDNGHHDHDHDDDHDHDHAGEHNPTGDHAGHHRVSTLTIDKATESDAGTYSCYEHDDKEEHDEINVVVNNKWGAERISLEHESIDHVHTGGAIVLVCNYYGTQANGQITWKKGGAAVTSDFDTKHLVKPYGIKSMLHKGNAALADQGEYTCSVGAFSDTVKVAVASSGTTLIPTALLFTLALIFAKIWV